MIIKQILSMDKTLERVQQRLLIDNKLASAPAITAQEAVSFQGKHQTSVSTSDADNKSDKSLGTDQGKSNKRA